MQIIDQEKLLELTESYLKSLISEVLDSVNTNFDSFAPFQELGIDSFYVLKIIKKLEGDFGALPKTLLFESFNINDLAHYFVEKHSQALHAIFRVQLAGNSTATKDHYAVDKNPVKVAKTILDKTAGTVQPVSDAGQTLQNGPILMLEKDAWQHSKYERLLKKLFERYKNEGSVSRGTRNIAPNIFIGKEKKAYFNYARSKNIILVYAYTGPEEYLLELAKEMHQHCLNSNLEFNIFTGSEVGDISGYAFSSTPFGVMQRIEDLQRFTLQGSKMRRLRYQVSKFEKAGFCKTEEYRCCANDSKNQEIVNIIDQWCTSRAMVNPLVQIVRQEILAGTLNTEHRLFLTYIDDALQNVVLISPMAADLNGYLMDLEFYPKQMPLGGLEFAIVKIIETLQSEGVDMLSLGGTYGCKLNSSSNADPAVEQILDDLRKQEIFNDEGNLQFKNKFRPESSMLYLSRPVKGNDPDNVIDIIMMIADPAKMETSDAEHHNVLLSRDTLIEKLPKPVAQEQARTEGKRALAESVDLDDKRQILPISDHYYNPLSLPDEQVEYDFKTDSWAQLKAPYIDKHIGYLHNSLQQSVNLNKNLKSIFPFSYFALTGSGRLAEHFFFKAWSKKGLVLQNLLFPTSIFHQIDNGFTPRELPCVNTFNMDSNKIYKGNLDCKALNEYIEQDFSSISLVCVEVNNNAAGGYPVSIQNLKEIKALLTKHSIPLVIDGTRVVENAKFIIENEREYSESDTWKVVEEIFSYADVIIASLCKDFCVSKGGIVATNDLELYKKMQDLISHEGSGLDVIDKKMIALSLQNRKQIESQVLLRMEHVRMVWAALRKLGVPIVSPAGGHCILFDVKQVSEFKSFEYPVASFIAWMYQNTGIRVGAHSAGMQKNTALNDLVRLAIPVGLNKQQIEKLINKLASLFDKKENIPEVVPESKGSNDLGGIKTKYALRQYHNLSKSVGNEKAVPNVDATKAESVESTAVFKQGSDKKEQLEKVLLKEGHRQSNDVAVIGMAGRYPKAKNLNELWENLLQGRDCIEDIPDDRLTRRWQYQAIDKYRGGFIDDIDKFDSLFFNISPREAEMLDPQERLFLEVAWEAIEDAGYYPETLVEENAPRNIGVYVGAVWTMYQMIGVEQTFVGDKKSPNSYLWSIANRVSYNMNLTGPSMTIDTACSSSLTAVYLACDAINKGECAGAIVGGVNLDVHQGKQDISMSLGALSEDGVCRSFGQGANGYVPGEGIGAIYLKPMQQALKDGDNIHGVIKSAVVNHGGRTSGYTVPNPKIQTSLISTALNTANVDARTVGYIEAHGTGTELGDPIEITGLTNAFQAYNAEKQACSVGSIKSNIGHLEAAAGVVGLCKVLLQIKHGQLVPSLHSSELNEFIDFENSPFYVGQVTQPWNAKKIDGVSFPLRAGVSSFGAGGANAHVILEEFKADSEKGSEIQGGEYIFPLSAKNEKQLREAAILLKGFLQRECSEKELSKNNRLIDVAHTLQLGRKSFESRLAIIAKTKKELIEKLTVYIEGGDAEAILVGNIKSAEGITRLLSRKEKGEFISLLSQRRDPHQLAQVWIDGLLDDWQGFKDKSPGRRISLPTYPFADKRHWASDFSQASPSSVRPLSTVVNPLLDTNESTFERQVFKKVFNEREFFIYDHLVSGIPTLPGVAYLEMARKAGEVASGRKVQKIKNILWVSPLTVENSTATEALIDLKPSGDMVQFEVFSQDEAGKKQLYSQGKLFYATQQELDAEPKYIDLEGIRSRVAKVTHGKDAYPLFKSLGLDLGPSFQAVCEVYKNDDEILGKLKIPVVRQGDFQDFMLHPSIIDSAFQAGIAAQLGGKVTEMFVPYTIGEVEILHPLQENCYSYATEVKENRKANSKISKVNVLIVDEQGKILVKIHDSIGVPLNEVHEKPGSTDSADEFHKLYYSNVWEKSLPVNKEQGDEALSSILLFDDNEELFELYKKRFNLSQGGANRIALVKPGKKFQELGGAKYTLDPKKSAHYERLFEVLKSEQWESDKICFAWPPVSDLDNESSIEAGLEKGIYSFFLLCQSLIKQKVKNKTQLLYVYSGDGDELQPHNEAISGFSKTLSLENPKLSCRALELSRKSLSCSEVLDSVLAEFSFNAQDFVLARYQAGERYIGKTKKIDFEESNDDSIEKVHLKEKGVYVITGGIGGLGLVFAEFLAREYKAKLVLTGRSALSEEKGLKLEGLKTFGSEVLYLPADVSKRADVKDLIKQSKSKFGEINGIIHAAGVLRDSYISNKPLEDLQAVLAPKLHGALFLDQATKNENLDFFVMFSSLAAIGGNAGQSDYAFANSFMDAFSAKRQSLEEKGKRYGKTLSINWSLWADGGMKLDEQTELFFKKNLGIKPLSIETGLEAFVKGLASDRSQFAVLEGVQEKIERAWGIIKPAEKHAEMPVAASEESAADEKSTPADGGGDNDLQQLVLERLSQIVMDFLKIDAEDISLDVILIDLGFDSIGLTTFANSINETYQLDITPVLFFEYPTLGEIVKYLSVEHKGEMLQLHKGSATAGSAKSPGSPPAQVGNSDDKVAFGINKGWNPSVLDGKNIAVASNGDLSPELRFVNNPIAVVGISGVMPQSENVEEFWDNLQNSKDMISLIPRDRWDWEDYYGDPFKEENKSNSKWGGFMKEIDKFDPLFFGISPREAEMMDPQQRIFLETVWKAIEDSGQKVSDLSGTKTGLFVGVATNDYTDLMIDQQIGLDGYTASGNSHSVLANRVSFLLDLRGPSAPLDTACSSSLVAIHRALESIHTGSSDMAIAGGVQLITSPAAYISFGIAGMLSDDGKCKTFDERANGYVRGEGSGAVFLKPLSMAQADRNHIYAVIKSTAENHGGRATALTAPNPNAQSELLIEAYEKAQIDPTTVGYIECHGTGTSLGDPIEIQALKKSFSELYKKYDKPPPEKPHCGLSAVKTNIGHLETAAGIAGMLKAILAIKYKKIPALLHFENMNPYIDLNKSPFYIVDKTQAWEAMQGDDGEPLPRRAGISSFGFGGANAHIVLEEYIPEKIEASNQLLSPQLIVLSAKNDNRLKAYAKLMLEYLEKNDVALNNFAYTLQVGRDAMLERLALVVDDTEELKQKLQAFCQAEEVIEGLHHGNTKNNKKKSQPLTEDKAGNAQLQNSIEQKDFSKIGELWVSGLEVDWDQLHESIPRRISLPSYPFARDRHWFHVPDGSPTKEKAATLINGVGQTALHSLVHRNISTLKEQKFASRFTGEEFYLTDHTVDGQKILPGVAYMEMARVAGGLSGEMPVRFVRNLVWMRPLIVGDSAEDVEMSFRPNHNEVEFLVQTSCDGQLTTHCTGKLAYSGDISEPDTLDISAIKQRCSEEIFDGKTLYPFLRKSGLQLGAGFQIVQNIYANNSESLSILRLPEHLKESADEFWLHPALMDGSLHTAIGLMKKNERGNPLSLPFSVGEVQILHPLSDLYYGYATWATDGHAEDQALIKLDFHLMDKNGKVLVRMKDFFSKPFSQESLGMSSAKVIVQTEKQFEGAGELESSQAQLHTLVPVWNVASVESYETFESAQGSKIVLMGGDSKQLAWVQKSYPNAQLLSLPDNPDIEQIQSMLSESVFDHLIWMAPDVTQSLKAVKQSENQVIEQQTLGVVQVFRIVKALLGSEYATKELEWTLITRNTQCVKNDDEIHASHAGVFGLVGSLAKECTHWKLRLLDIEDLKLLNVEECLRLPFNEQGNGLAHRCGEWFEQGLSPLIASVDKNPAYKQKGVYVVVGGAGGLGEVWSRYMIERYDAQLIWIGRQEQNRGIEDKASALGALGQKPIYISADATQANELQTAMDMILELYPKINGVVHSAIVLRDQSLREMDEADFRASLSAKVDVTVNLDRVFGMLDLDFMLFFSSMISFMKTPGQSNYAAGCAFKDSFAQSLGQRRSYSTKIINWGYWGNVGIVADEHFNEVMQRMGIGSIEVEEGMACLESLLGSNLQQSGLLKTLNDYAFSAISLPETMACFPEAEIATLTSVQKNLPKFDTEKHLAGLKGGLENTEMDPMLAEILVASLKSIGLFNDGISKISDLVLEKQPAPFYEKWLNTSINYLQKEKLLDENIISCKQVKPLNDLWRQWELKKSTWDISANEMAHLNLLEACLKALPSILSGKKLATDIMFPNSSMELVEGIYQGNALADYFNQVLGQTLSACIKSNLNQSKDRKVRILEIGAGTGGTTAKLLPVLEGFKIEEYCYTDLSKVFLMHAEKHYQSLCPTLTTSIFDVSKPLSTQSITPGYYDFVIATNVLHATSNIRETLRNAKAALKTEGVLLLNEISGWSLFGHLTFGLLEGWWLYEDDALRFSGSPGLTPDKWQKVLVDEGFGNVVFPAKNAHELGQQIIAASSDGLVRQRVLEVADTHLSIEPVSTKADSIPAIDRESSSATTLSVSGGGANDQIINDHIRQVIIEKLSEELRMKADSVQSDQSFADYGVDSIIGVNLVRRISEALQVDLEITSLFEYSTVSKLTQYIGANWKDKIRAQLNLDENIQPQAKTLPAAVRNETKSEPVYRFEDKGFKPKDLGLLSGSREHTSESIAIIGMSGRFSQSESLSDFWQNIKVEKNLVSTVSRWQESDCVISKPVDGEYCRYGSFIDSIDLFDPSFFGISQAEAIYMDPQQRLFLEESWKAVEDAGYADTSIAGKLCGVFAGCANSYYEDLFGDEPPAHAFWGNSGSVIPARIAYYLNLQGPAVAVDTACSSSLVSIHLACQSLWSYETEMALAGGVYLQPTPGFYRVSNRAGMLSTQGKCYSFDARADGFVPGEGVGVLVLKRLQEALQDKDYIHGVISASGINQDGSSNGLIAPNPQAQERLIQSVYDRFNIDPETIQVIEAHGTGTILGDSIEYGAVNRSFRKYTEKEQFCAIGTVKTSIGHAATAAGVAGVLKLLQALKHKQIPPYVSFEENNPAIDFKGSPFYINKKLKDWEVGPGQPRRSAISSFGFSGTNAHLVIEEAPDSQYTSPQLPGYLVVLSARTESQLKQQAEKIHKFAIDAPNLSMNDLSYTLFKGRTHFNHRLACVARSQDEMVQLLAQWIESGKANQIYTSEITSGNIEERVSLRNYAKQCIQECSIYLEQGSDEVESYWEHLSTIGDLYVQGYALDYHALFSDESRKIPLPTYPFAREKYWIEKEKSAEVISEKTITSSIHPLLHRNTSDLHQQSYTTTFNDKTIFLSEEKEVPAVSYLEMTRAAIDDAISPNSDTATLELYNVAWAKPSVLGKNKEVTIALFADNERSDLNDQIEVEYEIYSDEAIHFQGRALLSDKPIPKKASIKKLRTRMSRGEMNKSDVYAFFDKAEAQYGLAYKGITNLYQGDGEVLAKLKLPETVSATSSNYTLHPSLMDAALQAGVGLFWDVDDLPVRFSFPFTMESLNMFSSCETDMYAWVRPSQENENQEDRINLDIDLIDASGNVCLQICCLSYSFERPDKAIKRQANWCFSELDGKGENEAITHLEPLEKIQLFVKQEIALQIGMPMEKVASDKNYIELGVTSLGITSLVQKTNHLLGVNMSPGIIFEYRDIQTFSKYLSEIYQEKIDALTVFKQQEGNDAGKEASPIWQELTTLRQRRKISERSMREPDTNEHEGKINPEDVLAKILLQDDSDISDHEEITF